MKISCFFTLERKVNSKNIFRAILTYLGSESKSGNSYLVNNRPLIQYLPTKHKKKSTRGRKSKK